MSRRADLWAGCRAGLSGGLAMVAAMLAGRLLTGGPALPDVLADAVTWLLPIELISGLVDTFKYGAKPLFFAGLLAGQLIAAVGLGAAYHLLVRRRSILGAVGYGLGLWLLAMGVLLPAAGAGFFGADLEAGRATLVLSSLAAFAAYGFGLAAAELLSDTGRSVDAPARDRERRALLGRGLFAALAVLTGGLAWLALPRPAPPGAARASRPAASADSWDGLTSEVTDNDTFYTVSKNFEDPVVDPDDWRLEIAGLVEQPLSFSYAEFVNLPARRQHATLICISNEVGGDLVGNALWKGVPLADLLHRAGIRPGVQDVVLTAADEYQDSIPIERALAPGTLLAFEMNGTALPRSHGFPVRLVVPGIYGMKNVKWLKRIELTDRDFKGYWQQRGWSDEAVINTTSRIDDPTGRARLPIRPTRIGGIAFAGDRGISKVEVSADGGKTWQTALLKGPLSPYTWALWRTLWQPLKEGYYRLRVRAYDGAGTVQEVAEQEPLPTGATGYHTIQVNLQDES